ncbi:MAG: tRNA uridine-5-carboxymethylaminomethyl(34) synthesis GTPase MnmE [Corallococcus sp.]|nr:tRNA uridine-5-carboxymethylaminomethyl(34) synthesis GTPase MnmE [Corallococcus sp.]
MSNTIVALSTPVGRSAVAVVRMSGEDSKKIANKIFSPMPTLPNTLKVGNLQTAEFTEHAMCVYFDAPRSYTGEDMVEFHCHGGVAVCTAVIETCLSEGARMAQNGEFSKRAFVNGKQNLSNAEGIIEMIDAETYAGAKAGSNLLENKLGRIIADLQDGLTDIISKTEVALDYPEEDIEMETVEELSEKLKYITDETDKLLSTVKTGKIIKYGVNVAIIGAPNVGKSSLLNALLGTDRAIVSDIEGTTRDTLSESVIYKDLKLNFVDTAGIRKTNNPIEAEGIRRAQKAVDVADVVLYLVDREDDTTVYECDKAVIKVFNKCDLYKGANSNGENSICVSAANGINTEQLKQKIYSLFANGKVDESSVILTNQRHIDCLTNAKKSLEEARKNCLSSTLDCVAVELKTAWEELGKITGTTANEEIIDRIYSKFCLGK